MTKPKRATLAMSTASAAIAPSTDLPLPRWNSPGAAADMLYDVREAGVDALNLALLRPRAKGRCNSVLELAFAKLNPIEPDQASPRTRCGMPTTARDHRLVLAPGVADPVSLAGLFGGYDTTTPANQRLLAAVLTIAFDRDRPLHDSVDEVLCFTSLHVARACQLTSLVVIHSPGDQAAVEAPHAHVLMLARAHHASGWGAEHPELSEDQHAAWAERWTCFSQTWRRRLAA